MKNILNFFKSIQFKIITIYILLLLIAIQVIGSYFAQQLETRLLENFTESINDRVQLLNYNLEQSFAIERDEDDIPLETEIRSIIIDFDSEDFNEIQVIDTNSRVLGTNNRFNQSIIGKRTTDLRIQRSLAGNREENVLYNTENGHRTLVISTPIYSLDKTEVKGSLYIESSIEAVYEQLSDINKIFANGTILAISVSALLGILVARTITKPITEMRRQAKNMATGDFSQKVNVYGPDEIGQLASTFNELNDQLQLATATTEGERRKLSSVLANMNDGVISTDRDGRIILMNNPAEELVRKTFEEASGEPLLEILGIQDEVTNLEEVKDLNSVIIDFSEDDNQLLLKANFSVIQDEHGEMAGFLTVISDVTEQEKIERERREFVANVSHELRTPLTTMRSYIEALTDGSWQDKEIAPKFLGVVQNETERMIRLVNDLLQLSKMDNKDYGLSRERVKYIEYIDQIVDRFEMNIGDTLTLERKLPKDQYHVWIDKDKLTQVLDNIISNAIKYSTEGGKIKIEVVKDKERLLTKITDQGVGIPEENLERIFERFYRVDKARTRQLGGTGLGLAIAKELINAHGGDIWASSQENQGTTIAFSLPLMRKKRGRDK